MLQQGRKQNVPDFQPSKNSESSVFSLFPFTPTDGGTHKLYSNFQFHTYTHSVSNKRFVLDNSAVRDSTGVQKFIVTGVTSQRPSLPAPAGASSCIKTTAFRAYNIWMYIPGCTLSEC